MLALLLALSSVTGCRSGHVGSASITAGQLHKRKAATLEVVTTAPVTEGSEDLEAVVQVAAIVGIASLLLVARARAHAGGQGSSERSRPARRP